VISLDEASAYVLERCEPLSPVRLSLGEALGCALAEPVHALENVPPFENTAVDGYAVRAADTSGASPEHPVELEVVATLAAGAEPRDRVGAGQAIRIMTGAPIPPGADAVVMVEDTVALAGGVRVEVSRAVHAGDAVRSVGDDVLAGQLLFPMLTELRPAHLGVLASVGYSTVPVFPRARVGVLSTGDELVEDGGPLRPGQIRESNRTMLLGLVQRAGAEPVDLGLVRDDKAAMTEVVRRAVQVCDAVVTSGGVSMGDFDLVKVVLDELGDMRWMQVAIKPAKPFAFGLLHGDHGRPAPVFGLPGNPVSSLVSFELLARPALRRMMGHAELHRPSLRAVADEPLRRRPDGKVHLVRTHGWFAPDGRWHVRSTGAQGSHQLAATAAANSLAVLPEGDGVAKGADVDVILLF
jgi:molybdenum cofactor synthesis domain-containing protein